MIYQSFPQCILNNSIRFVLEFSSIVTVLLNNDTPKQSPYHVIRPALLFPFLPVAGKKTRLYQSNPASKAEVGSSIIIRGLLSIAATASMMR